MNKEIKIYHVETQEDYDDLMIELEKQGYKWASGDKPTDINGWVGELTVVYLNNYGDYILTYGYISTVGEDYPDINIIKHKAKGVEQMEKVVVPQFVADWYEEVSSGNYILGAILNKLGKVNDSDINLSYQMLNWKESCDGRHLNTLGNAQEVIAKMHLYGYEVEEEKKYYWRKKKECYLDFEYDYDSNYINLDIDDNVVSFDYNEETRYFKTKFTETEVRELVSEEDFNKLEKVEIDE